MIGNYKVLTIPFARDAAASMVNVIPDAPLSPSTHLVSWEQGFPYVTTIPLGAGGVPPEGQDFNGVLQAITEHIVFQNQGGMYKFKNEIVQLGGYQQGAVLQSDNEEELWISLQDNNTQDFNGSPNNQWARVATIHFDTLISGKFDAANVTQSMGTSQTLVPSQNAVSSAIAAATSGGLPLIKPDPHSTIFKKASATDVSIKGGTSVFVDGGWKVFATDTPVDIPPLTAGEDYLIYIDVSGDPYAILDEYESPAILPAGAVAVGGFHMSLTPTNATPANGSFATSGNGMIWNQNLVDEIKGINAYSFWDLRFRRKGLVNNPSSPRHGQPSNHGFALDPNTNVFVAIYFTSDDVDTWGLSRAGTNVASGTVPPKIPRAMGGDGIAVYTARNGLVGGGNWWDFQEVLASHGARHPYEHEFNSFAFGTTEQIVLGGSSVTIPMTKREDGYTSRIGIEQVSGHHWIWSMTTGNGSGSEWSNNNGGRGQQFGSSIRARLGGNRRNSAASCGSRAAVWSAAGSDSVWYVGARAVDDLLVL